MQLLFTVAPQDDGCKLAMFLRRQGMSTSRIRSVKYLNDGICVNGARARTNQVLRAGDTVQVSLPGDEAPFTKAEDIPLHIVFENEHAMVVDKPAGMVMHPTRSHKTGTLAGAFAGEMRNRGVQKAFRPVGRLDADTSGLVLCAMNAYAAPVLSKSFTKEYIAIVEGVPANEGVVDLPLGAAPDSVIRQMVIAEGRSAVTHYTVLAASSTASVLRLWLETGRTHQIRAHMAHIGHPLLGDGLYGGSAALPRHALHCAKLQFTPPAGEEVHLTSKLPADMRGLLESCEIPQGALAKEWL